MPSIAIYLNILTRILKYCRLFLPEYDKRYLSRGRPLLDEWS
jgi:hypothetical protein